MSEIVKGGAKYLGRCLQENTSQKEDKRQQMSEKEQLCGTLEQKRKVFTQLKRKKVPTQHKHKFDCLHTLVHTRGLIFSGIGNTLIVSFLVLFLTINGIKQVSYMSR